MSDEDKRAIDVVVENIRLKMDLLMIKVDNLALKLEKQHVRDIPSYSMLPSSAVSCNMYTVQYKCRRCKEEKTAYRFKADEKIRLCGKCENEIIEEYESDEEDPK